MLPIVTLVTLASFGSSFLPSLHSAFVSAQPVQLGSQGISPATSCHCCPGTSVTEWSYFVDEGVLIASEHMLSAVSWMWAALLDRVSGIDSLFLVESWLPLMEIYAAAGSCYSIREGQRLASDVANWVIYSQRRAERRPAALLLVSGQQTKVGTGQWCVIKGCKETVVEPPKVTHQMEPHSNGSAAQQDWWLHFHLWCLAVACFYAFMHLC